MTRDEFETLCYHECKANYGDVIELHLDDAALEELTSSWNSSVILPWTVKSVTNPATGTAVKIVRLTNVAVVHRLAEPRPPEYRVLV